MKIQKQRRRAHEAVKDVVGSAIRMRVTRTGDWECRECRKLLGRYDGSRMEIRVGIKFYYLVGLPVTSRCPGCGTLNEYTHDPDSSKIPNHN